MLFVVIPTGPHFGGHMIAIVMETQTMRRSSKAPVKTPGKNAAGSKRRGRSAAIGKVGGESAGPTLTAAERIALYGARRFIGSSVERKLKIRIPFDVYFQDPLVAGTNPKLAFDEDCFV